MLKQRVITALLALPLFFALFRWAPSWVLMPLFMGLVGLGTYEMAQMLGPRLENAFTSGFRTETTAPIWLTPTAVGFACLIFLGSSIYSSDGGRGMVLAGMLGGIVIGSFIAPDNETAFGRVVALVVSIVYGSFPWLATWDLFLMDEGTRNYVFFLCAVVWSGDTGAYFGGKRFGQHKLAPRMSPNKTWEGAVAGILGSLCGGLLFSWVLGLPETTAVIVIASVVGGAFGQMGDLVESTFKRFAGVKDSGSVFPGHGGFLDRVDGLLFAAPIIWFILYNLKS